MGPAGGPAATPASAVAAAEAAGDAAGDAVGSIEGVTPAGNGFQLNFESADVGAVAKAILGDVLHANYLVDKRVAGQVTLTSSQPVARARLVPLLETALASLGATVVKDQDLYRVVPTADPGGIGAVSGRDVGEGYGTSVITARFMPAANLGKLLEGFGSRPGSIKTDSGTNLVIITGTASERRAAIDAASTVDVDWMRSKSVAILPVANASPDTIINELNHIIDTGEGGMAQGAIQLQPMTRSNSVLAVARTAGGIELVRRWVARLDRGDAGAGGVKVYRLQYAQAKSVASALNDLFGSGERWIRGGRVRPGPARAERLRLRDEPGAGHRERPGRHRRLGRQRHARGRWGGRRQRGRGLALRRAQGRHGERGRGRRHRDGLGRRHGRAARRRRGRRHQGARHRGPQQQLAAHQRQRARLQAHRARHPPDGPRPRAGEHRGDDRRGDAERLAAVRRAVLPAGQPSLGLSGAQNLQISNLTTQGLNLLAGGLSSPRVFVSALQGYTNVKVLSSPSLVVLDRQPAVLQVGNQVPILTRTAQSTDNAHSPVVNNVDYKDTGIILNVLPKVNANGVVTLDIEQQVSAVVSTDSTTLTPTISQRRVRSSVAVSNGQTVMLAGLISDTRQNDRSGIPGVGSISFLNELLTNHDSAVNRTEIIVLHPAADHLQRRRRRAGDGGVPRPAPVDAAPPERPIARRY